jgi:hypothetical protein
VIATCGVWLTEARELPSEDVAGMREVAIIKHFLGCVRFDAWQPPFKPGWISVGVPPDERCRGQAPEEG